jgi:hypothetical protein
MLALDDGALARLMIAATGISPKKRTRWLRELATKLDGPTIATVTNGARSPAAVRQAKVRANRKAGQHHYGMWLSDRAVCGLIMRLVLDGRLTEAQAMKPRLVAQALAALLEEEGQLLAR